jgi:hypothetical protein
LPTASFVVRKEHATFTDRLRHRHAGRQSVRSTPAIPPWRPIERIVMIDGRPHTIVGDGWFYD